MGFWHNVDSKLLYEQLGSYIECIDQFLEIMDVTVSISNIPGRLRLEKASLIGRKRDCECLEEIVASMDGVNSVKVNSRTGRILICYDHSQSLEKELFELLNWQTDIQSIPTEMNDSFSAKAGELLVDLAIHLTVPSPFDMLVPIALRSFK